MTATEPQRPTAMPDHPASPFAFPTISQPAEPEPEAQWPGPRRKRSVFAQARGSVL